MRTTFQSDEIRYREIKSTLEFILFPAVLTRHELASGAATLSFGGCCFTYSLKALSIVLMPLLHQGPALQRWNNGSKADFALLFTIVSVQWQLRIPSVFTDTAP